MPSFHLLLVDPLPLRETSRSQRRFWEVHIAERQLHPGKDTVGVLYLQVRCPSTVSDLGPRGCGHVAENCGEVSRVSGRTQSVCAGLCHTRVNLANLVRQGSIVRRLSFKRGQSRIGIELTKITQCARKKFLTTLFKIRADSNLVRVRGSWLEWMVAAKRKWEFKLLSFSGLRTQIRLDYKSYKHASHIKELNHDITDLCVVIWVVIGHFIFCVTCDAFEGFSLPRQERVQVENRE